MLIRDEPGIEISRISCYYYLLSTGSTAGAPDDAMSQYEPRQDGSPRMAVSGLLPVTSVSHN